MDIDFEGVSNKDLRKKCVEYGLPNVPITDTSRKLMEKRLKAAILGAPSPNTSNSTKVNRRETMHEVKMPMKPPSTHPTPDKNPDVAIKTPSKDARTTRRTIAAMEKTVSTTSTTNNIKEANVRLERIILHQPPEQPPPQQMIQKSPMNQTLYPQLPAKETSPQAVHLVKSQVLTTSYIQEPKQHINTPLNSTYTNVEKIDSDDTHLKISPQKANEKTILGSYSNKLIKDQLPPKTIDLVDYRKETSMSRPMAYNYDTKIGTYSIAGRSSLGGYNSKVGSQPIGARSSFSGSMLNKIPQQQQRKQYTSNYNKAYLGQYTNYDDENNSWEEGEIFEDDDDDIINDSPLGKDIQTPYLSEFTRNLKNLKATPLTDKSTISNAINYASNVPINFREREINRRHTTHIAPRRTFQNPPNKNNITFRQFLGALEEKYHLKQTCLIICIFSLAIFIYVFFIQSA